MIAHPGERGSLVRIKKGPSETWDAKAVIQSENFREAFLWYRAPEDALRARHERAAKP